MMIFEPQCDFILERPRLRSGNIAKPETLVRKKSTFMVDFVLLHILVLKELSMVKISFVLAIFLFSSSWAQARKALIEDCLARSKDPEIYLTLSNSLKENKGGFGGMLPPPAPLDSDSFVNANSGELIVISENERKTNIIGVAGTNVVSSNSCERNSKLKLGNYLADKFKAGGEAIAKMRKDYVGSSSPQLLAKRLAGLLKICSEAFPEVASISPSVLSTIGEASPNAIINPSKGSR
jgi:hypothetical protein